MAGMRRFALRGRQLPPHYFNALMAFGCRIPPDLATGAISLFPSGR